MLKNILLFFLKKKVLFFGIFAVAFFIFSYSHADLPVITSASLVDAFRNYVLPKTTSVVDQPIKTPPLVVKVAPPAVVTTPVTTTVRGSTGPVGLQGPPGPLGPTGPAGRDGNNADTSAFVSRTLFNGQIDRVYDSVGDSIDGVADDILNDIEEGVNTNSLEVSGDATIGGALTLEAISEPDISTADTGLIYYDTDDNTIKFSENGESFSKLGLLEEGTGFASITSRSVKGKGIVTLTNGSATVTGIGTDFLNDDPDGLSFLYEMWVTDSNGVDYFIGIDPITTDTSASIYGVYSDAYATLVDTTWPGVTGTYSYYLRRSLASGDNNISLGLQSFTSGTNSMAIGNYSVANTGIAIGTSNVANVGGIALGRNMTLTGNSSVGVGINNTVSGANSLAFGLTNTVSGTQAGAFGYGNTTSASHAFVLGYNSTASGAEALTVGQNLTASAGGSVVIGSGNGTGNKLINNSSNTLYVGMNSTIPTLVVTGGTGVGTLGNVGIANTAPAVLLHIGSASTTDATNLLRLEDANSTCNFTADAGAPTCGSDRSLKKDITNLDNADILDRLTKLDPVSYHWLTDNDNSTLQYGFVAQNVQEQFPNLVKEGTWVDGSQKLFLSMGGLMPYTVGAIKELDLNLKAISGTVPPIEGSASESFVTSFFSNIFSKITGWLADAGNGIAKFFAGEVHVGDKLCTDDVCINKDQLKALLIQAGGTSENLGNQEEESSPENNNPDEAVEGNSDNSQADQEISTPENPGDQTNNEEQESISPGSGDENESATPPTDESNSTQDENATTPPESEPAP